MKIHGSLVFGASSASEIQNLRIQKYAGGSVPAHTAADIGRLIFVTSTGGGYIANTIYQGNAGAWVAVASGPEVNALLTELGSVETSLGSGVNSSGVFDPNAFTDVPDVLVNPTSFTDAINQVAGAVNTGGASLSTLDELTDVTLTTPVPGQVLVKSVGNWLNRALVLSDISDISASPAEINGALGGITAVAAELNILDGVTASTAELNILDGVTASTAELNALDGILVSASQLNTLAGLTATTAELNILDGVTATTAELNILDGVTATTADLNSIAGYGALGVSVTEFSYVNGVTGPIQAQLDGLQTEDATLTGLSALNGTGIVVGSAVDTFTYRSLVQPAAGLTISNATGVAGNPTFELANDLAALEGLTTTGYIVRTADGTASTRTFTGQAGRTVVTNGDGVSSDTIVDLATLADAGTGSFVKITRDTYGRVSGTTPVLVGDITTLTDGAYVNSTGDTMTGNLNMGANFVVQTNAPTLSTQTANKAYVDSSVSGLVNATGAKAASVKPGALASGDTSLAPDADAVIAALSGLGGSTGVGGPMASTKGGYGFWRPSYGGATSNSQINIHSLNPTASSVATAIANVTGDVIFDSFGAKYSYNGTSAAINIQAGVSAAIQARRHSGAGQPNKMPCGVSFFIEDDNPADGSFWFGIYGASAHAAGVNPSTMINCAMAGADNGDTYVTLMWNDGTGACTKATITNGITRFPRTKRVIYSVLVESIDALTMRLTLFNWTTNDSHTETVTTNIPSNANATSYGIGFNRDSAATAFLPKAASTGFEFGILSGHNDVASTGVTPVSRTFTGAASLQASDVGATHIFNSGTTAVLTVLSDSAMQITPGQATIAIFIKGTAVPTFTGSGATILGSPPVSLAQNGTLVLSHTGDANTWSYP